MNAEDTRWKQRFQNFERSLHFLEDAMKISHPDIIQKAGLIQFFEICFELSWKLMKNYMEEQGLSGLRFPRESIRHSLKYKINLEVNPGTHCGIP